MFSRKSLIPEFIFFTEGSFVMETRSSLFLRLNFPAFLGVCVVVLTLVLQASVINTCAQEQPQPAQSQGKKPETSTPRQPAKLSEKAVTKPGAENNPGAASEKPATGDTEKLANSACMDCHNPDILKLSKEDLLDQVVVPKKALPPRSKPLYAVTKMRLSLDMKRFGEGVHADVTCVTCHKDVTEIPHSERLNPVNCKECHEDAVDSFKASAHGGKGPKALGCVACHDVHYTRGADALKQEFRRTQCLNCHKANGMDLYKGHSKLYEARLHLGLDCMLCHKGKEPGVHNILPAKKMTANCQGCHSKYSVLSAEKTKPTSFMAYIAKTSFINADVLKKFGYVLGANRIPALDAILVLAVIAPLGLPVVHGGLRILTRRKEPLHLPEEKILLHPLTERIWHWFQALCIVMLICTGVMLHWPEKFPGWFNWAVKVHNIFGIAAVVAFLTWFFYNLGTGRISHYIPRKWEIPKGIITQARFYGFGIFRHEPHPYAPTEDNKFNPLQKIAYLQFQALLLPILLITGILYMYPETFKGVINALGGMTVLGIVHLLLGTLFAAFLVAHIYLATTGETIGENFKAIIFGYGIKSDHDKDPDKGRKQDQK
jgi:predicted CXXCH cytochrome family protein